MSVRRALLAALLAVSVLPAAAQAQARAGAAPAAGGPMSMGVLVGFESGDGDTGVALRFDGILDQKKLSPKALLSGVLSLGFTRFSDEISDPFSGFSTSGSMNLFKIIPAARFTFDVAPQFDLYLDAGVGMWFGLASVRIEDDLGQEILDESDNSVGAAMRIGGGAQIQLSPTFSLGFDMAFNPYFGDYEETDFTLMGQAVFRM
jgi:hypothetical protein